MGKQAAALALAMACNCQGQTSGFKADDQSGQNSVYPPGKSNRMRIESCGACKSCKKIAAGNHPDIIRVQPSGSFIKIEQIRALLHTLSMKPYEAKTRVVIVSEAQCMNASASNALLKLLEEPPECSMLVLIATRKSDLLPTIVSRCQSVKFNRISKEYIASWLATERGLEPQAAEILAVMANGSLDKAQMMIKDNWLRRRKWVLAEMNRLALQPMARLLALAEKLSQEKATLAENLEIIKVWFRDMIINRYDTDKIINQDVADQIRIASQQMDMTKLLSKVDAVQKAQNRLTANTNLRLSMERLLIQLAQP